MEKGKKKKKKGGTLYFYILFSFSPGAFQRC